MQGIDSSGSSHAQTLEVFGDLLDVTLEPPLSNAVTIHSDVSESPKSRSYNDLGVRRLHLIMREITEVALTGNTLMFMA